MTRNSSVIADLAKRVAEPYSQRVYHSARQYARDRFAVSVNETDDGWSVDGEGEDAFVAEYGRSPTEPADPWAIQSIAGAINGRA